MTTVTLTQLCRELDKSAPTVRNYIARGMPFITEGNRATGAQWEFDLQDCLDWYEQYQDKLLEEQRQREENESDEDNSAIVQARIEKLKVETQRLELRLARERKELVPIEDVARIVEQQYAMVKAHLLALPNKLAPIVAGHTDIATIDNILSSYVAEALSELSTEQLTTEGDFDNEQDSVLLDESDTEGQQGDPNSHGQAHDDSQGV